MPVDPSGGASPTHWPPSLGLPANNGWATHRVQHPPGHEVNEVDGGKTPAAAPAGGRPSGYLTITCMPSQGRLLSAFKCQPAHVQPSLSPHRVAFPHPSSKGPTACPHLAMRSMKLTASAGFMSPTPNPMKSFSHTHCSTPSGMMRTAASNTCRRHQGRQCCAGGGVRGK